MTVDLDAAPAPEPFVPDWCTVGARVCIITDGQYGNNDHVGHGTVKTIGKRDVIVTYDVRGTSLLERWRHTDYYGGDSRGRGNIADSYTRYHSNGRMGGYRLTLTHFDNPVIERIKLVSAVDTANTRVRSLMHKYGKGSVEENSTLATYLGLHTGAIQALDKYDAEKAADK